MKVFVINLKKDIERNSYMKRQLKNFNIPFSFFEWIDARNLSKKDIKNNYNQEKSMKLLGRNLRIWEIWCWMSHKKIWEQIVSEKIEISLILEDDVQIDKRFLTIIDSKFLKDYTKRDMIYVNYTIFNKEWIRTYINHLKSKKWQKKDFLKNMILMLGASIIDLFFQIFGNIHPWIFKRFKPLYLMWGYFITESWAKKLLSVYDSIDIPCDIVPERYRKTLWLKMFFVYPLLMEQKRDTFETNIQNS